MKKPRRPRAAEPEEDEDEREDVKPRPTAFQTFGKIITALATTALIGYYITVHSEEETHKRDQCAVSCKDAGKHMRSFHKEGGGCDGGHSRDVCECAP